MIVTYLFSATYGRYNGLEPLSAFLWWPRRPMVPSRFSSRAKAHANRGTHQPGMGRSDVRVLLRRCRHKVKAGFTPDEIGKIGGRNCVRIFGEVVGK